MNDFYGPVTPIGQFTLRTWIVVGGGHPGWTLGPTPTGVRVFLPDTNDTVTFAPDVLVNEITDLEEKLRVADYTGKVIAARRENAAAKLRQHHANIAAHREQVRALGGEPDSPPQNDDPEAQQLWSEYRAGRISFGELTEQSRPSMKEIEFPSDS